MPIIRFEFYRPTVHNGGQVTFAHVLEQISRLNAVERIRRGVDPAVVLNLNRNGNEYIGEAARIRMEDLPSVVDIATGDRHDLNVRDREGLGEEIHFLYDSGLNIIAVQRKGPFRASALMDLFSDLTHSVLGFQIVLRRDAWVRFGRMDRVKKIYFKLARPHDFQGQRRPALKRVFREMEEFNGVSAKIEISVGREHQRRLRLNPIRAVVEYFQARRDDFTALSITGAVRDEEEIPHQETIDFIKGRLEFSANVDRRGRRLDPEGCRLAIRRALRENRAYLHQYNIE